MAFLIFTFLICITAFHSQPIHEKPILEIRTDMSVDVTIYMASSDKNTPMYYFARLQSPVCMENLCNPVDIEIEWDLLGDFMTYKEVPGEPITKFDHQPFTKEDHEKLKKILSNKESMLQDYKIEDLVDTTQLVYSEEIDGMTGATSKTFENDIVPGAVYTCYVLWNFVNGPVHESLLAYTKSQMNDKLLIDMIHARSENYLNYILEGNSKDFSDEVNSAVGALIWDGTPIISVKAVIAVNDAYWQQDSISRLLADRFLKLDIPVQNALLLHFQNKKVSQDYLYDFISLLPELNKNQRYQVYEIFKLNATWVNAEMKAELLNVFNSPHWLMSVKEYELLSQMGIAY